jgi:hypothetical protein
MVGLDELLGIRCDLRRAVAMVRALPAPVIRPAITITPAIAASAAVSRTGNPCK